MSLWIILINMVEFIEKLLNGFEEPDVYRKLNLT